MKFSYDDFPYGPFRDALETIFGKLILSYAVCASGLTVGAIIGGAGLEAVIAGIFFPFLILVAIFGGSGLLILPVSFVFVIMYVKSDWPMKSLLFLFFAYAFLGFETTSLIPEQQP